MIENIRWTQDGLMPPPSQPLMPEPAAGWKDAAEQFLAERDELRKEVERLVARVKELEVVLQDVAAELNDAERWACCIEARDQKQADYRGNAFRSVQKARVQAQVALIQRPEATAK